MSLATQDFILELMPGKHPPHVKATQYDAGTDGWKFAAHLRYNDEDFAVPSGYTATVEGSLEPRGLAFRVNATIDGSVVNFSLDTGDLPHGGRWWAKILLKKGDSVLQTSGFVIDADPAGTQVGTVTGGKGFEQQIKDAVASVMDERGIGIDKTLTVSGSAADAKVAGDKVAELKSDIKKYNAYDLARELCTFPTLTHNGVTFTYNASNHTYNVNTAGGDSTGNAWANLLVSQNSLPSEFIPGNTYKIIYNSESPNVYFTFVEYNSGGTVTQTNFNQSGSYTAPSTLTGIIVRLYVPAERSVSNATVRDFAIVNTDSNAELKDSISELGTQFEDSITDLADSILSEETNLFTIDPDTLFGMIIQGGSHSSAIDTLGMTGYIPVTSGNYYSTPITNTYCLWYASDKSYLSRTERPSANGYLAPTSAAYGRFIFAISTINDFYVKEYGATYPKLISNSLIKKATPYKNKYGVAFGTSLTERGKPGFSGGYTRYLQTVGDMCILNNGNSSGTILPDNVHPQILTTIKNYSDYENKDFVLLEGFTNDWYYNGASMGSYTDSNETTVCGCLRSALTHIMQNAPYATLIFILDTYGRNYNGVDGSSTAVRNGLTQYQFYEELAKVAESLSVPVIKLYEISGINEYTPNYFLDNIHPTLKGAEQTANAIWSVMKDIPLKVS